MPLTSKSYSTQSCHFRFVTGPISTVNFPISTKFEFKFLWFYLLIFKKWLVIIFFIYKLIIFFLISLKLLISVCTGWFRSKKTNRLAQNFEIVWLVTRVIQIEYTTQLDLLFFGWVGTILKISVDWICDSNNQFTTGLGPSIFRLS